MKQIYYTKKTLLINGKPVEVYNTALRYAEAEPSYESLETTDWEQIKELLNIFSRAEIIYTRKNEIKGIRVWVTFGEEIYKKKNIQSIQILEEPVFYKNNPFTFEELQRILTAEEFVEWLKDRGITKIF